MPTIWIINDPSVLGPAVSRRMNFALEFRTPQTSMRKAIAGRLARKHRLSLSSAEIDRLATLDVAPALLDNSLKTAVLTDGKVQTVEQAVQSVARLVSGIPARQVPAGAPFDPTLCVATTDVAALVTQLARAPSLVWSLLAYGPPGTGKSAMARCIAERSGLTVLERKASDLLDMYVGNTEKSIARAFEEAADTRSMLIIDEADVLLRDRRLAQRGWEASMTGEMLTWMERSPTPFVATTNLQETLDPATSRRFLFKVGFKSLDPERCRFLFRHFFNMEAPPGIDQLSDLTPGDFALVSRKAAMIGTTSPAGLLDALANEAAERAHLRPRRIGFCADL